jgi:pectate lyase
MRGRFLPITAAALVLASCGGSGGGETGSGGVSAGGAGGATSAAGGAIAGAGGSSAGGNTPVAGNGGSAGVAGATGTGGATGAGGAMGTAGTVGAGGTAGTAGAAGTSGAAGRGGTTGSGGGAGAAGRGGAGGSAGGAAGRGGSAGSAGAAGRGGTGGSAGAAGTGSAPPDPGQPIGFATLNGGTTGGKGAQVVTVSTYADLKMYGESTTAYIIRVQGTISNGANGGKVSLKSNKTVVGVGSTALLNGVGLEIANNNNVIIQNLRMTMTGVTTRVDMPGVYTSSDDEGLPAIQVNGGDVISISGTSKNIWIDHCELYNEDPSVQTNHDLYDGLIDIKGQTGFITISWNYLHDHHKAGLVGASDTDLYDDRKITFHHNYYNKVLLRMPMYRGSVGHFFNNYVVGAQDATEIRAGTCVRVEKNYYEALHYSIYTPSDSPGSTERIDNVEVSRTSRAYPANCTADIPYSYSSALTATTNDVKTIVPQMAGVGKVM